MEPLIEKAAVLYLNTSFWFDKNGFLSPKLFLIYMEGELHAIMGILGVGGELFFCELTETLTFSDFPVFCFKQKSIQRKLEEVKFNCQG